MSLKGATQLRARLRAARLAFKDYGRNVWGPETVKLAHSRVAVRTGRTRDSIRVKSATQRKAVVEASGGARFLESGTQAHDERPRRKRAMKFESGGRTVFAKKVHKRATAKRPFLRNSAADVLKKQGLAKPLIDDWNAAA